jgi:hypothetical protein
VLYLHGGWPKTSTTTLQTVLASCRDELAAEGFIYPDGWMAGWDPVHRGLSELLAASMESSAALDELVAFLCESDGRRVMFSNENFTVWLVPEGKRRALVDFLTAVQTVMPTSLVWTLRRYDDFVRSFYYAKFTFQTHHQTPAEALQDRFNQHTVDGLFSGLRATEEAVQGRVTYLKYEAAGTHNEQLLDAVDLPVVAGASVRRRLRRGPRLNTSISHKGATVLANLAAVSERAGVSLTEREVRRALLGGFRFSDGGEAFQLFEAEVRRDIHRHALAAAERHGIASYGDFFADAEIEEDTGPVGLRPEALTDEDVQRLVSCIEARRG